MLQTLCKFAFKDPLGDQLAWVSKSSFRNIEENLMSKPLSEKKVRLQDIASVLGLSVASVSRALVGHPAISEATREKVQSAAVLMGYEAKRPGNRKRRVETRTIGVLLSVTELHNRFLTMLLENIHHDLMDLGYHVMVIMDPMNTTKDMPHLSTFRPVIDGYLDGMILLSVTPTSFMVQELQRLNVPVVLTVRSVDKASIDVVESDNVYGGVEIMRHLYELGHRRIGLVMGPEASSTSRDRARGALEFLREQGVPQENTPVMYNAFSYEAGYSCATQMLSSSPRVTAIMAGGDGIALGVLEAARAKKIEVPSQLSIVGFDNIPLSGSRLISLSTIDASAKEMSRVTCRRIVDRIRTGALTPPTHDILPVQLIRRDTSAPPSQRD